MVRLEAISLGAFTDASDRLGGNTSRALSCGINRIVWVIGDIPEREDLQS